MEQNQMGSAIILPEIKLESRKNIKCNFSGLDSFDNCVSKEHFLSYAHSITYHYNSRGFRDKEWPDNIDQLSESIWCIGDSFTVGIGSPLEFIWPQILEQTIQKRCINVSLDGASNDWISRTASRIVSTVRPRTVVVLWSYFHRREHNDDKLPDELRRLHHSYSTYDQDLENFQNCVLSLVELCNLNGVSLLQGIIPLGYIIPTPANLRSTWDNIKDQSWPAQAPLDRKSFNNLPLFIQDEIASKHKVFKDFDHYYSTVEFMQQYQILSLPQLDHARDYHHFDILTSRYFVDQISKNC